MHDWFANAQRIFTLDAQISHRAIDLRIDNQKLILGVAVREWLVFPLSYFFKAAASVSD